jgi:hypothetical protein
MKVFNFLQVWLKELTVHQHIHIHIHILQPSIRFQAEYRSHC